MLLGGGNAEQLVRMTEVAAGTIAARDALTLAESTRLELAEAVRNAVGMDEAEMGAPDPKSPGALDGGTTHGLDPAWGSHARRTSGLRGYACWVHSRVLRMVVPPNGLGAQRPAFGNLPLTTANALSPKLPDSIGAGGGRSAAAPCWAAIRNQPE
jgi:hypothetical protein